MYQCPTCEGRTFRITGTRTVSFTKRIICDLKEEDYDTLEDDNGEVLEEDTDWDDLRCVACKKSVDREAAKEAFYQARLKYYYDLSDPNQLILLKEEPL